MRNDNILTDILEKTVSEHPERTAILSGEDGSYREYSYKEIHTGILRTASFLKKKGVKKDGLCALILDNRKEWPLCYFGVVRLGAVCVHLNHMLSGERVMELLEHSGAGHLITTREIFEKNLSGKKKDLPETIIIDGSDGDKGGSLFPLVADEPEHGDPPEITPEQVASLIYTSGTTAKPKGVLLTHRNLSSNFRSLNKLHIFDESDNIVALLPLYHSYPFMVTLITPLLTGSRITYFPVSYRKDVLLHVLKTASVTVLPAVPQYYNILHSEIFERFAALPGPLRSLAVRLSGIFIRRQLGQQLRLLVSGGARLDEQIEKDFSKAGFAFSEGYGLTETSPIVTFNPPENPKFGSVGISIPDVEIRVHEPDDSGEGEVCVKGESVMKGYYKDQEGTREAIREGWFHTGDLGRIDADGYLFLTGRKKEVIVLGSGKNIYPSEVEEHYLQSNYIKEICVLENPRDGRSKGKLTALIIPDMEYIRRRNEKNIREKIYWSVGELSKTLPEYERIHGFQISSEPLPRTTLGKVRRHEVRERFRSEKKSREKNQDRISPEDDEDIRDKETARKIMNILSRKIGTRVDLSDHLEIDLGIDSLERVQLAMGLEKELDAKLPDEIFYENDTVKKLIMALTEYLQEPGDTGRPEKSWKDILKEKPPERELEKLYLDPSPVNVILTGIFVRSFYYGFKGIWGLNVKGRENIPSRGPYLICPNHNSYLDGLVITGCLPVEAARDMFFLVYRQILRKPAFSWSSYFARLVPIDPEADFITTMRIVSYLMEKEKAVCFFPEGNRSFDGDLQEFKKGAGIMMKELDVPVVPAYIKGTFESWPSGKRFPRPHPLEVKFGKPVKWDDVVGKGRKDDKDEYAAVAEGLRAKVKELQNSGGK